MKQETFTNTLLKFTLAIVITFFSKNIQSASPPIAGASSFETDYTIYKVRIAKDDDNEFIVASSFYGTVLKIDYSGNILWENKLSGYMNQDIWCSDIDSDGKDEILAANADGSIYAIDDDGSSMWSFKQNDVPMNAVCVVDNGTNKYVVCGGYDLNLYYLNTDGILQKEIYTGTFGEQNPWHDGVPKRNTVNINFLRPVKRADGSEFLVVDGRIHNMATNGKIFLFEILANAPFKTITHAEGNGAKGDFKIIDSDHDGNEEVIVGSSEMIGGSWVIRHDLKNYTQQHFNMNDFYSQIDQFGYRITQPEIIQDQGTDKYIALMGTVMAIVPTDMNTSNAELLRCKYSFNDMWKDGKNNNLILASAQSGGSCIHVINLNNPTWKSAYQNLNPKGNVQKILNNTSIAFSKLSKIEAPTWEHKQRPVYTTTPNTSLIDDIKDNYSSPVFLGTTWHTHVQEKSWRTGIYTDEYLTRNDGRMTYDLSQEAVLNNIMPSFDGYEGSAFWGGHGNDPLYFSLETMKKVVDRANGKKTIFIFPELESHSSAFANVLNKHIYPLAEYAHGKNTNIYVRTKNIFWQGAAHMALWDSMKSGKYADVFIPGMEETSDKMMDVSVPGRMGFWLSGSVDTWGTRCARDNTSYDRSRQNSHQMIPNHFLRQYIYNISSGATFINRFGYNADYMAILWHLIAKGVLYVPDRDELLNISPVHLSMIDVNEHYLSEGTDTKYTIRYDEATENANKMVFSRMNGTWPGASLTEWDYSTYASGIKDRRVNFLPPNPNGLVLITPAQAGKAAQPGAARGLLKNNLHPIYKNIMTEFYTDGHSYYSADGNTRYNADDYYTTVKDSIESGASKLPITVSGEVAWVSAQSSPNHIRLTLIDGGYINPSDKTALVKFNTVNPVKIVDLLDGKEFTLGSGNSVEVDIPCGLFRFLDIELDQALASNYKDTLVSVAATDQTTPVFEPVIRVGYETTEKRKIHIELENTTHSTIHGSVAKEINGSENEVDITFIPNNITNTEDSYRWAIYLSEFDDSTSIFGDKMYVPVNIQDTIYPTGINIVEEVIQLNVGDTLQLTHQLSPEMATLNKVIWSSDNAAVTVDTNGIVIAKTTGFASITAVLDYDNSLKDVSNISVLKAVNLPDPWKAEFIGSSTPAANNEASYIDSTFTLVGNGKTLYGSSDELHFLYREFTGDVIFTAKLNSLVGDNSYTKGGIMIRNELTQSSIHSMLIATPANGTGFQFRPSSGSDVSTSGDGYVNPGSPGAPQWLRLVKTGNNISAFHSADGTNWEALGNPESVLFNETFYIGFAVNPVSATVTASATFSNVAVERPSGVNGVSVSPDSVNLPIGSTISLSAAVTPTGAANQEVIWFSNNWNVASVNETGTVTALSAGIAEIAALTIDGGYIASCKVVVPAIALNSVAVSPSTVSLAPGETQELTLSFEPVNTSNKKGNWTSADTSIAEVNGLGVITAKNSGSTFVSATTEDGNHTVQCAVTVKTSSIEDTKNRTGISVLPNPFRNKATLSLPDGHSFEQLQVIDYTGKVIFTQEIKSMNILVLDESNFGHLNQGVYLLKLSNESSNCVLKLIRE